MSHIDVAKSVFNIENEGLRSVADMLDLEFSQAVETILKSKGRVIVCGMGKSGIVGKKISATLASTGTQTYFMHPAEAFHGDLGMVNCDDIFIAISYSGETEEVLKLLPFLSKNKNALISITGNPKSTLAKKSSVHLSVKVPREACPLQLAPTASTTATLVMGDAIAVALMKAREFKEEDFAIYHPGGALGRRLLLTVADEMITNDLPRVSSNDILLDVLQKMTSCCLGIAIIENGKGSWGIITDGDVRRILERDADKAFSLTAKDMATPNPMTVEPKTLMAEAITKMENSGISSLLVVMEKTLLGVIKR